MGTTESNLIKGCLSSKPKRKKSNDDSPVFMFFHPFDYYHIIG